MDTIYIISKLFLVLVTQYGKKIPTFRSSEPSSSKTLLHFLISLAFWFQELYFPGKITY